MTDTEKSSEGQEISRPLFDYLLQLAALDLSEEQAQYLLRELNHQLRAIQELAAIPLDEQLPVTTHGVPFRSEDRPGLRADKAQPFPDPQEILHQAPKVEDDYFVVPDIPHTTLE